MVNQTTFREFCLLGFSDIHELQILHFVMFFLVYLATLMGNFLIIITVIQTHHLHSPMYFFLVNLSVLDVCYISTTVPKSMANSLMNNRLISFSGCVTQVFLIVTFAPAELFLLTMMAYDRYAAICHPLQYSQIMNWNACFQMAAASWISSIINGTVEALNIFSLQFCNSNIEQFFCDVSKLLIISCTHTRTNEILIFASLSIGFFCFLFILVTYGFIFSTVFKLKSAQARQKAFSTCIPHLTIFCLFFLTAALSFIIPKSLSSPPLDLLTAILYTVSPPLMNPIIYSLRNKEIQTAMKKMLKRFGSHEVAS